MSSRNIRIPIVPTAATSWFSVMADTKSPIAMNAAPINRIPIELEISTAVFGSPYLYSVAKFIRLPPINVPPNIVKAARNFANTMPIRLTGEVRISCSVLIFRSSEKLFIVSSGTEIFTAETAMIDLMSEYPCSTVVRPLNLESSLVFLSDVTGSTLVREYFIQADSMQCSAADITAHVPGYLPNNMAQAVALPNNTMLLLFSPSSPGDLSVYRYFWSGNEKPQSSWSRFSFPFRILAIAEFDEIVYFLGRFSDTGSVELFRFDPGGEDEWLMDSAFTPSLLSYDAERDCTSLTFPLDIPPDYPVKVVHTLDDGSCYSSFTEISRTSRMLTVAGDLSTGEVLLGIPFESSFELSELLLSSDGNSGMLQGRLQLRTLLLSFTDTGNFRIEVSYPGRETMIHNYTGVVLGEAVMAGRSLRSERRRFAVLGNAANLRIKIVNDGILPSTFDSLSFEGIYHVRSQRT